jgi:hypothetical protein
MDEWTLSDGIWNGQFYRENGGGWRTGTNERLGKLHSDK